MAHLVLDYASASICLLWLTGSIASAQPANPPRLSYATYAAPVREPVLYGLATDSAGSAYVAGVYLGNAGAGSACAFLTKLNQTGTAAVWSVCLPVAEVNSVALDSAGYIYAAGDNHVSGYGSPPYSATVMKLSPDATQVVYSTSIPGTLAAKLALDGAGDAYILGVPATGFQATPGAYLTTAGDAFVLKLSPAGSVEYATYLDLQSVSYPGGVGDVAVDSQGQAWIVGAACPPAGLVGMSGCNSEYGSASAIRKLDAKGANLLVSKTFGGGRILGGGAQHDSAYGVAVDATDSVWVVGLVESSVVPTTPNAIQPQFSGNASVGGRGGVGYAVKLSPSGDLLYGTYVGTNSSPGGGPDRTIISVAADSQGRPYFALNVPSGSAVTPACAPSASVMALSADGSSLLFAADMLSPVQAVALDGNGGLYVAGNTTNMAFLTTLGVYQASYPGGAPVGYVAKFDLTTQAPSSKFVCLENAASLVPGYNELVPEGAVAPGEIVTLVGAGFPANPTVTFDGIPAPILYADAQQINAVVPFEVAAPNTVVAVADVGGHTLPVWPAVPALFTANSSGSGQLAALNQDGTVNSTSNPAKAGSIVSVYMTGVGAIAPPLADGQPGPLQPPFPAPVLGVSATVNGVGAPVLFAGQAPGLIAGAIQVNVQIPAGTPSGNAGLIVYIGNYRTQIGPNTIAVL